MDGQRNRYQRRRRTSLLVVGVPAVLPVGVTVVIVVDATDRRATFSTTVNCAGGADASACATTSIVFTTDVSTAPARETAQVDAMLRRTVALGGARRQPRRVVSIEQS